MNRRVFEEPPNAGLLVSLMDIVRISNYRRITTGYMDTSKVSDYLKIQAQEKIKADECFESPRNNAAEANCSGNIPLRLPLYGKVY